MRNPRSRGSRTDLTCSCKRAWTHFPLFFKKGLETHVLRSRQSTAVTRVLRAKFELGLFERPYVDPEEAAKWNGHPDHRRACRDRLPAKAIVLLKNHSDVLPLEDEHLIDRSDRSGCCGDAPRRVQRTGERKVSILKGIQETVREDRSR